MFGLNRTCLLVGGMALVT